MPPVRAFTAERMQQIEDTTVVSGLVDVNGHLILSTRAGDTVDAGQVKGAPGTPGAAGEALPAGTVVVWTSDVVPTNWLICDGSAISRTTYASLFAAIGVKYGAGDGSTTFNIPNLKGRVPAGKDASQTEFASLALTGGEKTHLLTAAESGLPAHNHIQGDAGINSNAGYGVAPSSGAGNINSQSGTNTANHPYTSTSTAANATSAHNILQPYEVVNFIIKTSNGDVAGDSQLTTRVSALENGNTVSEILDRKIARLQLVLTGGGVRKVAAGSISWSRSFVAVGSGRDTNAPSGYFEIAMPANGVVIPIYYPASGGASSTTVTGGAVPLLGWQALYYEVPLGQAYSSTTNFRIVDYQADQAFTIPNNWILICTRNGDGFSPVFKWGDGRSQDPWRALPLANGWAAYSVTDWGLPAYRWSNDGRIELKGLVAGGTGIIATLDSTLTPDENDMFFQPCNPAGLLRIDVQPGGAIYPNGYMSSGNNGWVELKGMSWWPKGS